MNTQTNKSLKSSKSLTQSSTLPKSSSLSSHFAMIELKQRILGSISKLSDRDTHQIAVEDLENIIQTISTDGVSMLLNCLYEASGDPKPSVKKEALRLIALLCSSHGDSTSTHLTKIIAHIVKRLKDSDTGVRDSCRDAIGALSSQYLKGDGDTGNLASVVSLFVKPLFEAMNEEKKAVQAGAAMCMARMVECAGDVPLAAFQKLCPRICKYLNSQHFLAKAALLSVIASLSQIGAISAQNMPILMQSIHDCLESSDWTTRKAAADTLCALSSHASHLLTEKASSTISILEASRFDKLKPVRDSIADALQMLKKIVEKESDDGNKSEATESIDNGKSEAPQDTTSDSHSDLKDTSNSSAKTVSVLKKKAPALSNKEVNPEFFQKLETKGSGDFPVEIAVPNRHPNTSKNEESDSNGQGDRKHDLSDRGRDFDDFSREKWTEARAFRRKDLIVRENETNINRAESNQREREQTNARIGHIEGSVTENKGNWMAIQRQLSQLERQQSHLMNMLQDFMGGSHNSMVTLENRVRGLERIIEDMQRDLVLSSGRRGYPQVGRGLFGDSRFQREQPSWRSEMSSFPYESSRNGISGARRVLGGAQNDGDQVGSTRRAWDKVAAVGGGGGGRVRLGEGPSARSVWHSSKDEATLEAIRFAGDDNGTSRPTTTVPLPELSGKTLEDEAAATWGNVMDAIRMGNMEMAYGEVLSSGDDFLLVKLMDKTGPVMEQLSDELGIEILHAIRQFLLEQNLIDIALSWIHQLVELVMENGPDVFGIPFENKRDILLSLREAASSEMELPQNWDGGMMPDQLMLQLASAWEMDLQQ